MEPLMHSVVNKLDGGMFTPFFATMLNGFNNTSGSGNCSFVNQSAEWNETYCVQYAPRVDFGKPLLAWYLGRLKSQVPLFIVAGLIWLLLLVGLIAVYNCLTRNRLGIRVQNVLNQKRSLIGLISCIILLFVVGFAMSAVYWTGRIRFSGMSELSGNQSTAVTDEQEQLNASRAAGRSHMIATFRQIIDEFDSFVELSIVETNISVLEVSKEALPEVLDVLEIVAKDLLNWLAADFKLSPLLSSFDEFIDLVKRIVSSMRAIKDSRNTVTAPLAQFATLIDSDRRDLQELTNDACSPSTFSTETVELCHRIAVRLNCLAVGIDHRRLNSDSSVTVVTLLENMLKLNFSQVEDQVKSAKGHLSGGIDLVRNEVKKLFKSLGGEISRKFGAAMVQAQSFRNELRGSKRDQGFLSAMESVDRIVHGLSAALAVGSIVFLLCFFFAMFVFFRYLMLPDFGGDSDTPNESRELDSLTEGPKNYSEASYANGIPNGIHNGIHKGNRSNRSRSRCWEPSDCQFNSIFASSFLVLAAVLYAAAVMYAGAESHMDACRYLTTETGVRYLDEFVYNASILKLWPLVKDMVPSNLIDYLSLSRDLIPRNLIASIMARCRNSSATIFQALGLSSPGAVINASLLLEAPLVKDKLNEGSEMIQALVRDLNTSNLIPTEVDDLLQKTLPSFAAVIDAENFAPSIMELNKPLLLLNSSEEFASLRGDLGLLESFLRWANASDRRPDIIHYLAEKTKKHIDDSNSTLTAALKTLLGHYTILQTNRYLTNLIINLTANAITLKVTLANKAYLLKSIDIRYKQTLTRHLPSIAQLANRLISRLLGRVGRCSPVRDILQIPITWCRAQIRPLPETGVYLLTSCFAVYVMLHLMLLMMHLIKLPASSSS